MNQVLSKVLLGLTILLWLLNFFWMSEPLYLTLGALGTVLWVYEGTLPKVPKSVGSRYRRHRCKSVPQLEPVRLTLTDELVAAICLGCGEQVPVEEYTAWADDVNAPKRLSPQEPKMLFTDMQKLDMSIENLRLAIKNSTNERLKGNMERSLMDLKKKRRDAQMGEHYRGLGI